MDKRLLTCAGLCKGRKIADIGTDHGYLPCYMIKEGLCDSAYACDVAEKPLESAGKHIREQGLQDKITTILSDGLEKVSPEGITDIVIAGMGGELIAEILRKCTWIKDSSINFVLQPMTKWDVLRKWLYDNLFEITEEKAVSEGKFVYSVMSATFTGKQPPYECDLEYLYCGKVSPDYDDGTLYLERQAKRLIAVGNGLLRNPEKKENGERMLALAKEINKKLLL